jgi:transcriptional regulator with GAF, ATPase, and Fis domain
MRQNTKVTFAMRDLDRLKCIQAVVDGDLKLIRAADRLGLTTRQVRRLARRYAARRARRFDLQTLQPAEQQPHG